MSLQTRLQDLATRIATECKSIRTMINGNAANLSALTFGTKTNLVVALNELKVELDSVASAGGATINDGANVSTTQTYSITKIQELLDSVDTDITDTVAALKAEILGGASGAYDTLQELQAILEGDATELAALTTSIGFRLRFDAAQTLTAPQKVQVNANAGSLSLVQSGDPETNLVTTFEAGLTT